MDSFIDQLYQQQNPNGPPQTPAQQQGTDSDYINQQYLKENPNAAQPAAQGSSYTQSFLKGLTSGTPTSPEEEAAKSDPFMGDYAQQGANEMKSASNEGFPNAAQDTTGKVLEATGRAIPGGALFGPSGAFGAGVAGGTEEYLKEKEPENPYYIQQWGPLITSLGVAPLASKLTQFGAKTGRSILEMAGIAQSPVNKLWSDLGINQRIAGASVADSNTAWPMQIQNTLRETLGGSGQIRGAEDRIFGEIEDYARSAADRLGPNTTQQELGERLVAGVEGRATQMSNERDALYNALNAIVPKQQNITPTNFQQTLQDMAARFSGAPALANSIQQSKIGNYIQALASDLRNSPIWNVNTQQGTIPYDTIQNIRTSIGEQIQKGLFNADVNTTELRALYRSLSADMRAAYPAGGGQRAFDTVNAFAEKQFDWMENVGQKLLSKSVTPEQLAQRTMAQINSGSTRFDSVLGELQHVDPQIKDLYLGQYLRELGENQQGEFSPTRFYNMWYRLSPEMQAQFGNMREGIQKLADASGITRDMFKSSNTSHTSGNLNIMDYLGRFSKGLATLAAGGSGVAASHFGAGFGPEADTAIGLGAAGAGYTLSPFLEMGASDALAHMWTSKWFNTWLATQAPNKPIQASLAELGALVQKAPDLYNVANTLINGYGSQQTQLQPGEKGRGFLGGGYAGLPNSSGYSDFAEQTQGYAQGGLSNFLPGNNIAGYADGGKIDKLPPLTWGEWWTAHTLPFNNPDFADISKEDKVINPPSENSKFRGMSKFYGPERDPQIFYGHGLEGEQSSIKQIPSENHSVIDTFMNGDKVVDWLHNRGGQDVVVPNNFPQDVLQRSGGGPAGHWMNMSEGYADGGEVSLNDNFTKNLPFVASGVNQNTNFNTQLSPAEESQFRQWVTQNKVPFNPDSKTPQDYDMRGFYRGLVSGDPHAQTAINPNDKQLHFSDWWKTPYHKSFSAESQWANPSTAPKWNNKDQLVTPDGKVVFDERAQKFAYGGLTDTSAYLPNRKYPRGFVGGGALFEGNNANIMGYAMGGPSNPVEGANDNSFPNGVVPLNSGYAGGTRTPETPSSVGVQLPSQAWQPWHERLPDSPIYVFDTRKDSGFEGIFPDRQKAADFIKNHPDNRHLDFASPKEYEQFNGDPESSPEKIAHNEKGLVQSILDAFLQVKKANDNTRGFAKGGMYNPQTNPIAHNAKQADHIMTSDMPHKQFAEGGFNQIPMLMSNNDNTQSPNTYSGYYGSITKRPQPISIIDYLTRNLVPLRTANEKATGGYIHNNGDDPRPFYNPQLPRAMGSNWAEGGPVNSDGPGNTDIAKQLTQKINKLDSLRTENELDPFLSFERIQSQQKPETEGKAQGGYIENPAMGYADGGLPANVQNYINLTPSYREGEIIPNISPEQKDLFAKELPSQMGLQRDTSILNMMLNKLQNDTPVWPHASSFEDAVNNPDHVGYYAEGGQVHSDDPILNTIMKYESSGKNEMNYINDRTHTASGYFQITNTTWRAFAPPEVLAKYPTAISAPFKVQELVAENIKNKGGLQHWVNFNPKLAAALRANNIYTGSFKDTGPSQMASSGQGQPSSILDNFLAQNQEDDDQAAQQDEHQQLREALNEGADPATKVAINAILGKGDENGSA